MRDLLRSLANTSRRESPSQPKCIRVQCLRHETDGKMRGGTPTRRRPARCLGGRSSTAARRRDRGPARPCRALKAEIAGRELYGARLLRIARQEARGLQIEGTHERLGQAVAVSLTACGTMKPTTSTATTPAMPMISEERACRLRARRLMSAWPSSTPPTPDGVLPQGCLGPAFFGTPFDVSGVGSWQ